MTEQRLIVDARLHARSGIRTCLRHLLPAVIETLPEVHTEFAAPLRQRESLHRPMASRTNATQLTACRLASVTLIDGGTPRPHINE
jgi:hypothetical protein